MQSLVVGSTLGQYQIEGELGRGGMGAVYRALHPALNRTVAIKILAPALVAEPGFLERFHREAILVANLKHPHILTVYDFGRQGDLFFIVMEYVAGGTLKDRPQGPMEPEKVTRLVGQIADALDHAHQHDIVHRDVKPANIMLERDDFAKLGDFGIARMAHDAQHLTRTGVGIGTPEYMSPEQGEGLRDIDGRSDIYSLGIVLFDLLTGTVPFHSTSAFDVIRQHIEKPIPVATLMQAGVSPELVEVVVVATAKSPAGRYQKAGHMREALEQAQKLLPSQGPTVQMAVPLGVAVVASPAFGTTPVSSVVTPPPPSYAAPISTPPFATNVAPPPPDVSPADRRFATYGAAPVETNVVMPSVTIGAEDVVAQKPSARYEPQEARRRVWPFVLVGLLLGAICGLGGLFFVAAPRIDFSQGLSLGIVQATPSRTSTPTRTVTATAVPTATRAPTAITAPSVSPTPVPATSTPEPEPTETEVPPTATSRPTNTPRPAQPTATPAAQTGGGIIELRNNWNESIRCSYSGPESRQVTVGPKSVQRVTTTPGVYNEVCTTASGTEIARGQVTVPRDTPLIRVADPPKTAGGSGTIVVRNDRREGIICAYNGPISQRLEVPAGGSKSFSAPAGSYQERCTTDAGIVISTETFSVPVDVDVVRVAR